MVSHLYDTLWLKIWSLYSMTANLPLTSRTVLALTLIETTSRTPAIVAPLSSTLHRGVWRERREGGGSRRDEEEDRDTVV